MSTCAHGSDSHFHSHCQCRLLNQFRRRERLSSPSSSLPTSGLSISQPPLLLLLLAFFLSPSPLSIYTPLLRTHSLYTSHQSLSSVLVLSAVSLSRSLSLSQLLSRVLVRVLGLLSSVTPSSLRIRSSSSLTFHARRRRGRGRVRKQLCTLFILDFVLRHELSDFRPRLCEGLGFRVWV